MIAEFETVLRWLLKPGVSIASVEIVSKQGFILDSNCQKIFDKLTAKGIYTSRMAGFVLKGRWILAGDGVFGIPGSNGKGSSSPERATDETLVCRPFRAGN